MLAKCKKFGLHAKLLRNNIIMTSNIIIYLRFLSGPRTRPSEKNCHGLETKFYLKRYDFSYLYDSEALLMV